MSLTSQLRSKDSWTNRFFKDEFANLTDFTKREGGTLKALPLKVPLGPHGQAMLVGTAFDYRLRLHLGLTPEQSTVLTGGYQTNVVGRHKRDREERVAHTRQVSIVGQFDAGPTARTTSRRRIGHGSGNRRTGLAGPRVSVRKME